MVVANILGQQALEVLLVQNDHVVQQVLSATPNPALRHTVLPRTAKGSTGGLASQVSHHRNHFGSKLGVVIEQEKSVRRRVRLLMPVRLIGGLSSASLERFWVLTHFVREGRISEGDGLYSERYRFVDIPYG